MVIVEGRIKYIWGRRRNIKTGKRKGWNDDCSVGRGEEMRKRENCSQAGLLKECEQISTGVVKGEGGVIRGVWLLSFRV